VRAVLDTNVVISALLSPDGAPATLIREWQAGAFELIVSDLLLDELERALAYPKLRERISPEEAEAVVAWLRRSAVVATDPTTEPPVRSVEPDDDYLIALAASQDAVLVSGDRHLLSLGDDAPVLSAHDFLERVRGR
jgi:putative PIN family toxin of toxin-antitoxin system